MARELVRIENLVLHFSTSHGTVQAVDGVDLRLDQGKAVVVLGESGCGKSSLAKAILRLLPRNVRTYTGHVYMQGIDLMSLSEEEFRRKIRWKTISMVPQAAMNALNPVLRVGDQVAEPAMLHLGVTREEALESARKMFQYVGVPDAFLQRYPFELSGGMRQRVAIAMALVTSSKLIILDEPTSALDVLTQASIFNMLKQIKRELGIGFILITHDIATASELADEVAVMYAGQIIETSDAEHFFSAPRHPYSQKLLASVPRLHGTKALEFIPGQPASLIDLPPGCRFAPRCTSRSEKCAQGSPPAVPGAQDGYAVRCWLYSQ